MVESPGRDSKRREGSVALPSGADPSTVQRAPTLEPSFKTEGQWALPPVCAARFSALSCLVVPVCPAGCSFGVSPLRCWWLSASRVCVCPGFVVSCSLVLRSGLVPLSFSCFPKEGDDPRTDLWAGIPFHTSVLAGVILQPWYSLVVGYFYLVVDVSAEERQSLLVRVVKMSPEARQLHSIFGASFRLIVFHDTFLTSTVEIVLWATGVPVPG